MDARDNEGGPRSAPLGLVAGGGQFPVLCARAARQRGRWVLAVAHRGETDPNLVAEVDDVVWIHLGQLGTLIKTFRQAGVTETLFAGTITKKRIFRDIRPDLRALALWRRLDGRLDDDILRAVARELESEGIRVLPSTTYLKDLLAPKASITRGKPTKENWEDIHFGWRLAKEVGRLDIGQCLVVKDRTVLAVEAIEGTDETILRGGKLAGEGAVVIKVCKPAQDTRFDLPAIGKNTIQRMAEVRAAVLAIEAGRTLLFDKEATVALADQNDIAIVGVQEEQQT